MRDARVVKSIFSNFWYENSEYLNFSRRSNLIYYASLRYRHLAYFVRRIVHYNNIIIIRSVSYIFCLYIIIETRDYAVTQFSVHVRFCRGDSERVKDSALARNAFYSTRTTATTAVASVFTTANPNRFRPRPYNRIL